jgi:hypothetical protein
MSTKKKSNRSKEHFLQIYFPLSIFLLLIVVSGILIINIPGTGSQTIQKSADISAALLIIPILFSNLIFLGIIILLIIGLGKSLKWIPIHFSSLHVFFIKIAIFIMNGSNKIVFPIISSRSKLYSLKSIWKKGKT